MREAALAAALHHPHPHPRRGGAEGDEDAEEERLHRARAQHQQPLEAQGRGQGEQGEAEGGGEEEAAAEEEALDQSRLHCLHLGVRPPQALQQEARGVSPRSMALFGRRGFGLPDDEGCVLLLAWRLAMPLA